MSRLVEVLIVSRATKAVDLPGAEGVVCRTVPPESVECWVASSCVRPNVVVIEVSTFPPYTETRALEALRGMFPHVPRIVAVQPRHTLYLEDFLRRGATHYLVQRPAQDPAALLLKWLSDPGSQVRKLLEAARSVE